MNTAENGICECCGSAPARWKDRRTEQLAGTFITVQYHVCDDCFMASGEEFARIRTETLNRACAGNR